MTAEDTVRLYEDRIQAIQEAHRDQLMAQVWGTDYYGETRTVDMHIRTLRQKLGPYGSLIQTVRNVGYRLEEQG